MKRKFVAILGLVFALAVILVAGVAASSGLQVRVLDQGDFWQVGFDPGEYAYEIEYLEGDMFVTVEAIFLDENQQEVRSITHTLVENSRMSAQRSFKSSTVGDQGSSSAVRFKCSSGRARVSFGSVEDIGG